MPFNKINSPDSQEQGFNLIQLLVALCIIAILASITYPSYQDAILSGNRGHAKGEIMRLADLQERWRLSHTNYATLAEIGGATNDDNYRYSISNHTNSEFSIRAEPINKQTQDVCGTLTLTQEHIISSSNPGSCPKP